MSCAVDMIINHTIAVVPAAVPVSPGIGHTFVSCPHPALPCLRSILWTKNDSPNRAFSSNTETGETISLMSGLSTAPITAIWTPLEGSLPPSAHDPAGRSVPPPHSPHIRISPESQFHTHPLLALSRCEICISEPIRCDTDNAISYVITCEICSLLPPYVRCCGTTLRKDSSERPFRPYPFGTGLASPHDPTRRAGVSTSI